MFNTQMIINGFTEFSNATNTTDDSLSSNSEINTAGLILAGVSLLMGGIGICTIVCWCACRLGTRMTIKDDDNAFAKIHQDLIESHGKTCNTNMFTRVVIDGKQGAETKTLIQNYGSNNLNHV